MAKVALFGGKFDPPHLAHQIIIFLLLEKSGVDEVWIVPSTSHPFGYDLTPLVHRKAMVSLMLSPWEETKNVNIIDEDDFFSSQPHYTIDLITGLRKKYPDNHFTLTIGEDNWDSREKWKDFDEIIKSCEIILYGRGENSEESFTPPAISSSDIRERVAAGKDVESLLPKGVDAYIKQHNLYR